MLIQEHSNDCSLNQAGNVDFEASAALTTSVVSNRILPRILYNYWTTFNITLPKINGICVYKKAHRGQDYNTYELELEYWYKYIQWAILSVK